MKLLLKKLDNPEKNIRCIHVAGTNGKGSVCAMISSVLADAGYRVGMYTSPHLKKFNERIKINDKSISDMEVAKYYMRVKKYVTNQSFFEITTAMMFLYFFEKKVDFVVLEVGMGGRLDSTNVIIPLVSIITNIGYEHTSYLGSKLDKIAFEKSGIIKENVPVVTGAQGIALQTIKKISNLKKSQLYIIHNKKYKNIELSLKGNFQLENAEIAIKAIDILKQNYKLKINKKNIENGLMNVKWPGRFEYIGKNIIIDCAHNPEGFKTLIGELKYLKYKKLIMILGFSKDKDVYKMSKKINLNADKIILTQANNERAANIEDIKKYFNKKSKIVKNSKKALDYAKKITGKNDLILVAGSIYLIGELNPN